MRFFSALLLAVALLSTSCAGSSGPSVTPESAIDSERVIAASEPFDEVVVLDWRGPGSEREALWAWVADTPEKRALGLMHRPELPGDAGMIFAFAQDHRGGFWMKNTLIPLSIAYLDADGGVVAILDMEPCTADPCPVYDPGAPYRYAVEANKGWFAERGVGPTWRLSNDLPEASA